MGVVEEGNHIGCHETPDMIAGTFFIPANARYYTFRVEWSPHGDPRISNHPLKKKNHIGYQKAPDMIAGTFFIAAHARDYTFRVECIRKPHGR